MERCSVVDVIIVVITASVFLVVHQLQHSSTTSSSPLEHRRLLSSLDAYLDSSAAELPLWAHQNLVSVTERPNPSAETVLFWHIPKSGGTTAKRMYECLGQTLANRLGADPRFGHDKDEEIVVFQPFKNQPNIKFVNVDTTTKKGLLRAAELNLVASKKADMIFTSDINFAADHLFDPGHRARIFALFRNPVDRSVSKFYYLQTATWERTYRPEWKDISIMDWAGKHNQDENFIVKKIVGKKLNEMVDITDLVMAKEIIRRYFVVGLMNDMEESLRRFNIVLGLDYSGEQGQLCKEQILGSSSGEGTTHHGGGSVKGGANDNKNSNPHPKVVEGSPEYNLLAERNALDMILFNYLTLLYAEQKNLLDSYGSL